MFKDVALWNLPVEQLRSELNFVSEMDDHDHAFLCGMIKQKNPKKLLEIGIAEGGTTAVIIKSLSLLGSKREAYSVDLSRMLYCDNKKKTGYEYDRLKPYIDRSSIIHQILLGGTIASQIEKIGDGIDFVIIDTTHQFPGEVLDFLCVLPYLAEEATILLHDINLNYIKAVSGNRSRVIDSINSVATKLLFSAVKAEKYLPMKDSRLPNIAAFTIFESTYENIVDLFYLLSFSWAYIPEKGILDSYRNIYEKYYDKACLELYDIAVANNQKMYEKMKLARSIHDENLNKYRFPYSVIPDGSKIVLYGAGVAGREVYEVQKKKKMYEIVLWVDKKYKEYFQEGLEVENPSNMLVAKFDFIVVAVEREELFQSIRQEIISNGWDKGSPIIGPISIY